ncbi:MAG: hypothetical protein H6772_03605 [Pseudomonadales bacterium]|nr:hypothetical protein [Pseudomonadales bacterium]
MYKKYLTSIFFAIFCLAFLVKPNNVIASELIGTHLGEGDVGTQINIINNILVPNGLEPGSPVTVMVGINMLQPSQFGTVQSLANAVKNAGYFPIVRINDVCNPVDAGSGITPTSAVEAAKTAFGENAIIVWGNEVNNKVRECSNWDKYAVDFISIMNIPNVSPAALDFYNSDYPANDFINFLADNHGLDGFKIYNSHPIYAANAYGCVGSSLESCDPTTTDTHYRGFESLPGTIYLTEFSLSPGGSPAPDQNLENVRIFIEQKGREASPPAVKITPLVRNICNNEGEWLLYVNGRFFTTSGTQVNEDECEGAEGSSEFDLSKYPNYDIDNELFFITPIRSVIKNNIPDRTVENLRKELVDQGYEAYCAAEDVIIKPEYNTDELIRTFLRQYPGGISLKTDSIEHLEFENAKYPIWRDVSDKKFLLSSLEEYFGFKDVYETDPAISEITTAPINSLLSQKQACVQGWKDLVAQELTCEHLVKPDECALFPRPVPGTNFTIATILAELKKYDPFYRDGRAAKGCEELFTQLDPQWKNLRIGLTNVPTYFDRAYRFGFVVAAIHAKKPVRSGNIATRIFNFFTKETEYEEPRDEVLAAAFKLPDIGTNKGGGEDTGHQYWDDPLDLTRQVLTTKQNQYYHEEKSRVVRIDDAGNEITEGTARPEVRKSILKKSIKAEIQSDLSKIYCYDGMWPNGYGSPSCKNALIKALTDIINGNENGCGEEEAVKIIRDMAGFADPTLKYGKVFTKDYGGQVLLYLFGGSMYNWNGEFFNPQIAKTDVNGVHHLDTIFTIRRNTYPPLVNNTTVDFYIVYPVGFELAAVEEAMKGAFFSREQIGAMDADPSIVDGFEMTDQVQALGGGSVNWDFVDKEKTARGECGTDPQTQQNYPCVENVNIVITQDDAGIGILGAKLGWWLRKIQLTLSSKISFAHDYYQSCKTMEEFLLGKCKAFNADGSNNGEDPPIDPIDPPISDENLYCVDWIGLTPDQVNTYKQSMRAYLMSFTYSTGSQKPGFITELESQNHIDWTGRTILPEETNGWEDWYGGGRALLWTKNPACGGQVCFDYIMDMCGNRGVNPAICIAMSITESGGLNHLRFPGSYDFGCKAATPNDIQSGLDCLLNNFFFSTRPRDGKLIQDMNFNEMWLQFAGEGFASSSYRNLENILKAAGEVGYINQPCN